MRLVAFLAPADDPGVQVERAQAVQHPCGRICVAAPARLLQQLLGLGHGLPVDPPIGHLNQVVLGDGRGLRHHQYLLLPGGLSLRPCVRRREQDKGKVERQPGTPLQADPDHMPQRLDVDERDHPRYLRARRALPGLLASNLATLEGTDQRLDRTSAERVVLGEAVDHGPRFLEPADDGGQARTLAFWSVLELGAPQRVNARREELGDRDERLFALRVRGQGGEPTQHLQRGAHHDTDDGSRNSSAGRWWNRARYVIGLELLATHAHRERDPALARRSVPGSAPPWPAGRSREARAGRRA